jgi:hypothetical protein
MGPCSPVDRAGWPRRTGRNLDDQILQNVLGDGMVGADLHTQEMHETSVDLAADDRTTPCRLEGLPQRSQTSQALRGGYREGQTADHDWCEHGYRSR